MQSKTIFLFLFFRYSCCTLPCLQFLAFSLKYGLDCHFNTWIIFMFKHSAKYLLLGLGLFSCQSWVLAELQRTPPTFGSGQLQFFYLLIYLSNGVHRYCINDKVLNLAKWIFFFFNLVFQVTVNTYL